MNTKIPNFVLPEDVLRMPIDQVYAHVTGIRERILASKQEYEALVKAKNEAKHELIQSQLEKVCTQFAKALASAEKACDRLETIAHKIAAKRLQDEELEDAAE